MRKRPSPANLTGTSGRSELRHRTSIGPGGVLPAAVCAACRQSDEHTPAGPEPRSTPCPPDSPADLTPPRGQPPGGAPEWLLWAPCTTAPHLTDLERVVGDPCGAGWEWMHIL